MISGYVERKRIEKRALEALKNTVWRVWWLEGIGLIFNPSVYTEKTQPSYSQGLAIYKEEKEIRRIANEKKGDICTKCGITLTMKRYKGTGLCMMHTIAKAFPNPNEILKDT